MESYDSDGYDHHHTLDNNSYFEEIEATINKTSSKEISLPKKKIHSFKKGDLIGVGAFGSVFQALNLETGSLFAVKEVHFDCFPSALLDQVSQISTKFRKFIVFIRRYYYFKT